jgi:hypothetical protein
LLNNNPRNLSAIDALRDSLTRAGMVLNVSRGGQRAFLLKRLQTVMVKDFFEFNAKIYQRFTVQALDNLYSFAADSSVAVGAGCVLDFLSTSFALQTLASIRYGPYRRSAETFEDKTLVDRDPLCSFFAAQTGVYPWDSDPQRGFWQRNVSHASTALYSLLLRYRVPDPLLRWMRDRPDAYEAEIRSGYSASPESTEVTQRYAGGPHYLLSAGGRHENAPGANFPIALPWPTHRPWVYDVIARPSSLLLYPSTGRMNSEEDIIHARTGWDGDQLALHRRFLYAYAPAESYAGQEWPFAIPSGECSDTTEYRTPAFLFRFCAASSQGVYLVFSKVRLNLGEWLWKRQHYVRGGLEVIPMSANTSLRAIIARTLEQNSTRPVTLRRSPAYAYTTWEGSRLLLNPRYSPGLPGWFAVSEPDSLSGPGGEPDWPRKWGEKVLLQARVLDPSPRWLAAVDRGTLRFRNPESGETMTCDFREWWRPARGILIAR